MVYESIHLRQSYRDGDRVRKRDIANLTHCDPKEVAAIELALQFKGNLAALGSLDQIELCQGPSMGAVWTVCEAAHRLGIPKALGQGFASQLALWQILARVLDQGSRLSAVRLAQVHAACDVLGIHRDFDENDLYANLSWLAEHQQRIEDHLFAARRGQQKPQLFFYDVTSSYLEGEDNAYGDFGCNRDGKKGKKQIVIGLSCDEQGEPVSTEVFRGNTQDTQTFAAQVNKASERFGCARVTLVGDRGMIKSGQLEDLLQTGFHCITAITKPQIETLLATGLLQTERFAAEVCEIQQEGVRYVLWRNPLRAEQLAASRADEQARVEHEASTLDGCYVIQTDLPESAASKSRSRAGGDAGVPDSAGTQPRLGHTGRHDRRGSPSTADAVLEGNQGPGGRKLHADSHAGHGRPRFAQSPGPSPAGSPTSHRGSYSHAQ
jgi:hypothetical protein